MNPPKCTRKNRKDEKVVDLDFFRRLRTTVVREILKQVFNITDLHDPRVVHTYRNTCNLLIIKSHPKNFLLRSYLSAFPHFQFAPLRFRAFFA